MDSILYVDTRELEKRVPLIKNAKKTRSLTFNLHRQDPQVSELLLVVLGQ